MFRTRLAAVLDFCADVFFSLGGILVGLAQSLDPDPTHSLGEGDLDVLRQRIALGVDHPCPTCRGEGWLPLPRDDRGYCQNCLGTGIDLDALVFLRDNPEVV